MDERTSRNDGFHAPVASVLIFGATGHLGANFATYVGQTAPATRLRLATSRPSAAADLTRQFPRAEIVVCSYNDPDQLAAAVQEIEAIYMVTPDFTNEVAATTNLVRAAEGAGTVRHIIRLLGDPPGVTIDDVPPALQSRGDGMGAAIGHQAARRILENSSIPVTFTNVAGYYMDDLTNYWYVNPIRTLDRMAEPKRHYMFYVDPAEVAEAGARILLRRDPRDIGRTFQLHNGVDLLDFYGVAQILSEELKRDIRYAEGPDFWRATCGPDVDRVHGEGATEYFVEYFTWEADMVARLIERDIGGFRGKLAAWAMTRLPRFVQQLMVRRMINQTTPPVSMDLREILGRRPRSLREWVRLHVDELSPQPAAVRH